MEIHQPHNSNNDPRKLKKKFKETRKKNQINIIENND